MEIKNKFDEILPEGIMCVHTSEDENQVENRDLKIKNKKTAHPKTKLTVIYYINDLSYQKLFYT